MSRTSADPQLPEPPQPTFLGVLTSDGPTPTATPARVFAELMASTVELLRAYKARVISNEELARYLARAVVRDATGGEWTVGAQSLGWYRRTPGLPWAAVSAPDATVVPVGSFPDLVDELRRYLAGLEPGGRRVAAGTRLTDPDRRPGQPAAEQFTGAPLPDQSVRAGVGAERSLDELLADLREVPEAGGELAGGLAPGAPPAAPTPPTPPLVGPFAGLPPRPGPHGTVDLGPADAGESEDDELFRRLLGEDPPA